MTPLPDVLSIQPFTKPAQGEVILPGSKSLTNRALLLAALCDQPVTLTGALFSEDTEIMAEALRRLGIPVTEKEAEKTIRVEGQNGKIPNENAEIFVGNAGTAARFLTALCAAAQSGTYKLDGVDEMRRRRPMKGLIDALRAQGAKITYTGEEGFFPFTIEAHGLIGGDVDIDASKSSQILSALFMVARLARKEMWIKSVGNVRQSFVGMTLQFMSTFGIGGSYSHEKDRFSVGIGTYRSPGVCVIEPDATAASYFLALPLVAGGALYLPGLRTTPNQTLQGDTQFTQVLNSVGANIADRTEPIYTPDPKNELDDWQHSIGVDSKFSPTNLRKSITQNFTEFSDTFLTLAAIAPLLEGTTKITGIKHTRNQETDRVAGMVKELRKLGQDVDEHEDQDGLTITPNLDELQKRAAQGLIEIETYNDHRFAMSFAILGCYDLLKNGRPWLSIKNPACCAKTFPNFFDVLDQVWKNSHSK
ncbi:MAG TPA: 3-phosphoshikimate 1-carboxyvinyltransferase [Opitutaceae bacterium]|jgi:3-phosphoshikimate 1-carboxyvinyltransferase|nr:3-phosphoshikimate 1-carboxyvinyltransferase [Opitutaceae bacterium]